MLQLDSATIMPPVIFSIFSRLLEALGERRIPTPTIVVPWVVLYLCIGAQYFDCKLDVPGYIMLMVFWTVQATVLLV